MQRDLREVIGNKLILNNPSAPIPSILEFIFFYETMFSIFEQAIKFYCLFLAIF